MCRYEKAAIAIRTFLPNAPFHNTTKKLVSKLIALSDDFSKQTFVRIAGGILFLFDRQEIQEDIIKNNLVSELYRVISESCPEFPYEIIIQCDTRHETSDYILLGIVSESSIQEIDPQIFE